MSTRSIWESVEIGKVNLRNRLFISAHTTNFSEEDNHHVTPRLVEYWRTRARGGVGLAISEGLRVHPTSLRRRGLEIFTDHAIDGLARLVEAVRGEGARMFGQLIHSGRHVGHDRLGAWSASPLPWSIGEPIPHAMREDEIQELVLAYGQSASRARKAGFDGLEIHIGHGHLLQQFLSPLSNHRTDDYGGSPDARLRIIKEVLTAVDHERGSLPVGVRISADEFQEGGLRLDDMLEIIHRLASAFELSFLHVSQAAYVGAESLSTQVADMHYGGAPFRAFPSAFHDAFPGIPVMAICRIDDLDLAESLIANDEADLAGLTRAHIADPNLVRKTVAGRRQEVRSCIACNQGCLDRVAGNLPMSCVVNPEVGFEREFGRIADTPPQTRQRVLVVGGGPSGLEAAATASRRGHDVTLAERSALGGALRSAAAMTGRGRFSKLVDELVGECERHSVDIRVGMEVSAVWVCDEEYENVILATGASRGSSTLQNGTEMTGLDAALEDVSALGNHVAIFDERGSWEAASLAEHLATQGVRVELLSPVAGICWNVSVYSRVSLLPRLARLGVAVHPLRKPAGLVARQLRLLNAFSGNGAEVIAGVTAIVHVGDATPRDQLLDELRGGLGKKTEIHVIGDAHAPRTALEAVYEGRLAGSAVGLAHRPGLFDGLHLRRPTVVGPSVEE